MPRERTGCVVKRKGKIWARISYTDENGKRRELLRVAVDRADARRKLKLLREELDHPTARREASIDGSKMTFAELADAFTADRITEPVYQGDRKLSGMRSYKNALGFLKPLRSFFGTKKIREISAADLEAYKLLRLRTPRQRDGKERTITSCNRELSLARRIFNWSKRRGFLAVNPFDNTENLISPADEVKRNRVLSFEEEARLLSVCVGKREHLRACILVATTSGLRKNEQFTLVWSDVSLKEHLIHLKSYNSKTAKARIVPISEQAAMLLEQMRGDAPDDALVFTCGDIKRSFATACRLAGIQDLHWHDLRHTFATRLAAENVPLSIVAGLLGHSGLNLVLRYANTTKEHVAKAAEVMNRLHRQQHGE
jgi:integrase